MAKSQAENPIATIYLFRLLDQFPKIASTLHGFHNLFTGIFHQDSGRGLIYRRYLIWSLFEPVSGRDGLYRNSFILLVIIQLQGDLL
jgi:hypothetical protein